MEESLGRYKDKLNLISERVGDIDSWIPQTEVQFLADKKTRLAIYKAFQEAVESCLDVVAMMCRDLKIMPKEDYANVEEICKKGIIKSELKDALLRASGLRNILVHRYNVVDDRIAFRLIGEFLFHLVRICRGGGEMVERDALKRDLSFLLNRQDVLALMLFGSQARGAQTPRSDVDICVVAPAAEIGTV